VAPFPNYRHRRRSVRSQAIHRRDGELGTTTLVRQATGRRAKRRLVVSSQLMASSRVGHVTHGRLGRCSNHSQRAKREKRTTRVWTVLPGSEDVGNRWHALDAAVTARTLSCGICSERNRLTSKATRPPSPPTPAPQPPPAARASPGSPSRSRKPPHPVLAPL
jgi:hypothetical protein